MNMVAHSGAKEDSTELVELEVTIDTWYYAAKLHRVLMNRKWLLLW